MCAGVPTYPLHVKVLKSSLLYTVIFPVIKCISLSSRSLQQCVQILFLFLYAQVTLHYEAVPQHTQSFAVTNDNVCLLCFSSLPVYPWAEFFTKSMLGHMLHQPAALLGITSFSSRRFSHFALLEIKMMLYSVIE